MQKEKETITLQDVWRLFQETDRRFQETDRLIRQTQKAIGDLGNRLGQFVQEMVKPAVVKLFRSRGIDVYRVISNMEADYGDEGIQVDLVVIDKTEAIVVECKSSVSVEDVNEHIKRLERFKHYWPEYSGLRLFGAIAGMVMPEDVGRYAYRQGLYVLVQSGDIVEIKNDERFEPKVW